MVKYCKHKTAKQRIADVLKWAERQGLFNIAEELRTALATMSDEPTAPNGAARSTRSTRATVDC